MTAFNCPGAQDSAAVSRPPITLYEVRTTHGESYWAEGDVIERGDGWFTLWASEMVLALHLPEADIRAVRSVTEGEQEAAQDADHTATDCLAERAKAVVDPLLAQLVLDALGMDIREPGPGEAPDWPTIVTTACRELQKAEAARAKLHRAPYVQGRCPACGCTSLFLGDGGYVTCPRIGCPEPDAASTLLDNPQCTASTEGEAS